MATRGDKWRQVATSGDKRRQMATRGDKWRQVATNGDKWQQMATSGDKRRQTATNDDKRRQMATNGDKRRQRKKRVETNGDKCVKKNVKKYSYGCTDRQIWQKIPTIADYELISLFPGLTPLTSTEFGDKGDVFPTVPGTVVKTTRHTTQLSIFCSTNAYALNCNPVNAVIQLLIA